MPSQTQKASTAQPSDFTQAGQRHLIILGAIATLVLFSLSSLRHWLFQSGAFDLGIFDQYAYLLSQGLPPISSFVNYHLLGDHAAYSFYLISFFYWLKADVHWLFLIQAVSLASAIVPIFLLAKQAGLSAVKAIALAYSYLLYPLVFNANVFDFHPEVMAVPTILWAVYFARRDRYLPFLTCLIFILGCKAILSLSVFGMGVWLSLGERKRIFGMSAITLGLLWFVVANQIIIPQFRPESITGIERYSEFGSSIFAIAWNILRNPFLVIQRLFTLPNLEYVFYLLLPVGWAFVPRYWLPFIGAMPILFINLITDYFPQKNIVLHYSLPILPFLILSAIATLAAHKSFLKKPARILIWSLIAFLLLGKYSYFWSKHLGSLDTLTATQTAVSLVADQGSVLTTHEIAPHLTHRPQVRLIQPEILTDPNLAAFDHILLNLRHPGWNNSVELSQSLLQKIQTMSEFEPVFNQDDVYLFAQRSPAPK